MPDGQSISAAGGSRHKAEKGGFLVLTHLGLSEFNFSVMHHTPLSGRLNPISILVLRDRHLSFIANVVGPVHPRYFPLPTEGGV